MCPIHLENLDVFAVLAEWMEAYRVFQPHWTIRAWERTRVICSLTWEFGTQLGSLHKAATSAQEAVELAVRGFAEWRESVELTSDAQLTPKSASGH